MLGKQPDLRVVGEVSTGVDAVDSAENLQPDLILLDVGLPKLNGLEAARQIAKVAPQSKVLFVSENRSPDIIEAALSTGAFGYVLKSDVGRELLPAVRAVLELRCFVSAGVVNLHLGHGTDRETDKHSCHEVTFYSDDAELVDGFAGFVESALKAGSAVIAILTETHHASLLHQLTTNGVDVATQFKQRAYIPLNVADILSAFMVKDAPDPVLFRRLARDVIIEAARDAEGERRRVAVCGEGVNSLLSAGNLDAAIELERMWNEIARHQELDILCGYFRDAFDNVEEVSALERVCTEHSSVHRG
jgi:CheY-like chemotaxis protein